MFANSLFFNVLSQFHADLGCIRDILYIGLGGLEGLYVLGQIDVVTYDPGLHDNVFITLS